MEVANTLAYYDTAKIIAVNSFIVQAPGRNARPPKSTNAFGHFMFRRISRKTFWSKFTSSFCKLDHFVNVNNIVTDWLKLTKKCE